MKLRESVLISSNDNFSALLMVKSALQMLQMTLDPRIPEVMDLSSDGSDTPIDFFI